MIIRIENQDVEQVESFLKTLNKINSGDFFHCSEEEGRKAFYIVCVLQVRQFAIGIRTVQRLKILWLWIIALRRNDREWVETLPKEMDDLIVHKLYYGHFLCHVFHQDYIVKKA